MTPNAFPEYESPLAEGDKLYPGMTLLDYFAGQALARVANNSGDPQDLLDQATFCYEMARAMLKAREAQP